MDNALKALAEAGIDSSYLLSESYHTLADADDIKGELPKDGEGLVLANGVDVWKVAGTTRSDHSFSPDDASYFQGVMHLKSLHPDLPVYEIHNHPTVEAYERSGIIYGDEEEKARQRLISSVPSAADIRRWNQLYNLVGAGIYSQDIDELRVWRTGDARHKLGSKLAWERDEEGRIVNAYWATQDENNPSVEYIQPKDWSEDNMQDLMNNFTPSTFAYKG